MNILFNGTAVETEAENLTTFLLEQGFTADSHVATAVNGQFVPKEQRETYTLNDGDSVEVVAPMQGG